jgi:hypothetical protein
MFIWDALIAGALWLAGALGFAGAHAPIKCAGAACANSCANVNVFSGNDDSGLQESEFAISAVGTFRIAGEEDEAKQPLFNLTKVDCAGDDGAGFECKVARATMWPAPRTPPDVNSPNCSLDLELDTYSMKLLQQGVLAGVQSSAGCYNATLTIDKNTKRVYISYTRTEYADNYDRAIPNTCGSTLPRTQVLMNCTVWPRLRAIRNKQGQLPPRYCDFSNYKD